MEARGVPGFDTRTYPGDDVMATWLEASPYRWVGYYLLAPCHTGTSWQGKRPVLQEMGWGMAVLFVGEQDWPEAAGDTTPATPPDTLAGEGRCTRQNLTEPHGRDHGYEAAGTARSQGFPPGTVIYLDVERVEEVSDSLRRYVRGWADGLMETEYAPGLYAHARNAETLLRAMRAAGAEPRLWVASPGGFDLRQAPAESGFPATIWQGRLDVRESWGGTTLRIDANVADREDPSG